MKHGIFFFLFFWGVCFGVSAADSITLGTGTFSLLRKARHANHQLTFHLERPEGRSIRLVELALMVQDEGNYASLTLGGSTKVALYRGGKAVWSFEDPGKLPEELAAGGSLVLRHSRRHLELLAGGKRIFRTLAPSFGTGMIGVGGGRGRALCSKVDYQRLEPLVFGDDFMRTEEEAKEFGLWKPKSGDWHLYSVMERIHANPSARIREGREPLADRSPNPFCLSGSGEEGAFILTGQSFWCDYQVAVSVRSMGSRFGLVFAAEDENNCWLLRWSLHSLGVKARMLELVHLVDGREVVVATVPVNGRTRSWYRLEVRAVGSRITALVDGVEVLTHASEEVGGGLIGLFAQGENETLFDDVALETVAPLLLARKELQSRQDLSGDWEVDGERLEVDSRSALTLLGFAEWPLTRMKTLVQTKKRAGIAFAYRDSNNYWRVVWEAKKGGRVRLEQVREGREHKIADSAALVGKDRTAELLMDLDAGGILRVFVAGKLCLRRQLAGDTAGRFGLYAERKTVFERIELQPEMERDWEHEVDIERFANDPFMQGWASNRYAWVLSEGQTLESFPQRYLNKGDFYGAFHFSCPLNDGIRLFFGMDDAGAKAYELDFTVDEKTNQAGTTLLRAGKSFASASFALGERKVLPGTQIEDEKIGLLPKTPDTVSYGMLDFYRDGHEFWVLYDGKQVFSVHDEKPLSGRGMELEIANPIDLIHVAVRRAQVKDYLFEKAMTDWLQVGTWEVTNRFACDPRWSHLNGRGKGVAALWSKLKFEGDFTIEYYAGMRMRQGDMKEGAAKMYYPRVGDINVALATELYELFSGYNMILQGWDPGWTETTSRFLKRGKELATTDKEFIPRGRVRRPKSRVIKVAWDPGGRPVHGAWYYIKIRKTGGRYDVSFDNVPVFTAIDEKPLEPTNVALWTQHNSIVIARAKVAYSSSSRQSPVAAETKGMGEGGAVLPKQLKSLTQPGLYADFEQGLQGLQPFAGDQSAELSTVEVAKRKGRVLRMENLFSGGDFGTVLPLDYAEINRLSRIEFDCRIPEEVRQNLYLSLEGAPNERWFVQLTGPGEETATLHRLGQFEVVAEMKNGWKRVGFNLGEAFHRLAPRCQNTRIRAVVLGMFHEGYLNAGLGGNPRGATWFLDNLLLLSHGPQKGEFAWFPREADKLPVHFRAWHSPLGEDASMPMDAEVRRGDHFSYEFPGIGDWQLHTAVQNGGEWIPLPAVPVRVCQPTRVVKTIPGAGVPWDGGTISIFFDRDHCANPKLAQMDLQVAGVHFYPEVWNSNYDAVAGRLDFFPNLPGLFLRYGAETKFSIAFVDDLLPSKPSISGSSEVKEETKEEKKAADTEEASEVAAVSPPVPVPLPEVTVAKTQNYEWMTMLEKKSDTTVPSLVRLLPESFPSIDFDRKLDFVPQPDGDSLITQVSRNGGFALRVENHLCGSAFGGNFSWDKVNIGKSPILTFDYRIGETTKLDFQAQLFGRKYIVGLTDRETERVETIGDVEGIIADGKWHSAEIDLHASLYANNKESKRLPARLTMNSFSVGDFGYAANVPGAWYELDSLRLIPTCSTQGAGLTLDWEACDIGGISGYSYVWDGKSLTEPDEVPETAKSSACFTDLPEGTNFFHIRALDNNGNPGPVSHYRFCIDNTLPSVVSMSPKDGSRAAASKIKLQFGKGQSPIDPSGVKIMVNKRRLRLNGAGYKWNPMDASIEIDLLQDWSILRRAINDGSEMTFTLSNLRDFAGNKMPEYSASWTVDYSLDAEAPPAPRLWSYSAKMTNLDCFGRTEAFYWRPFNGRVDSISNVEAVFDEQRQSRCLEISKGKGGKDRFGGSRYFRLTCSELKRLVFDICIVPESKINIYFRLGKEWRAILLTGNEAKVPVVHKVEGVRADGKWQHFDIDFQRIFQQCGVENLAEETVSYLAIGSWSDDNARGAGCRIDNFGFIVSQPPLPLISYSAADPTGISGYRISFDQKPVATGGAAVVERSSHLLLAADKPGMWFIHAAARDGAGNWSETIDFPYYCEKPVPPVEQEGIEAEGKWTAKSGTRGVRAYSYSVQTPGKNRLEAVQLLTSKAGVLEVTRKFTDLPLSGIPEMQADIFSSSSTPLTIRAEVRGYTGARIESEPVALLPNTWNKNVSFLFKTPLSPDGEVGSRWTVGFMVEVEKRARYQILFDSIRITSGKQVENKDVPAPEKE